MGAGGSVEAQTPLEKPQIVAALKAKLDVLKEEANKSGVEDTPRGETAKSEVKRLRALLKNTLEENVQLEKCLENYEADKANAPECAVAAAEEEESEDDGPDNRVECAKCERKFNPDRIEKHASVCKGTKAKKPSDGAGDEQVPPAQGQSSSGDEETPKWKKDREKLKEQLKRDMSAPSVPAASDDAAAPPAEATAE